MNQDQQPASRPPLDRLVVKSAGRFIFLRAEEIDWIEASGNYVCLHVGEESHLLRRTMKSLEEDLDPLRFLRIHRSTIVNLERIKAMEPLFHGDFLILLYDGTQLTLSRRYRMRFEDKLGRWL